MTQRPDLATAASLAAMLEHQQEGVTALKKALPALEQAVINAQARLSVSNGRLIYAGAGTSARIGVQDGVELWPTFGWPLERVKFLIAGGPDALIRPIEGAEDDSDQAIRDFDELKPSQNDVLIALAASGSTPYTCQVVRAARAKGLLTIGLANKEPSAILDTAEISVYLNTGTEFLPGSTRMAAGTAQKIALNLFSTQLMAEMGRIYEGYMVHLVATNEKLRRRAVSITKILSGKGEGRAKEACRQANYHIPLAVLLLDGLDHQTAEKKLKENDGNLYLIRG